MAVNYFGSIRVTKACLPLLKDAAGVTASNPRGQTPRPRVVMIASMAGKVRITGPWHRLPAGFGAGYDPGVV
eukprot:scaffold162899_cov30-Tisochrysis_lutea.AAC.4